MHNTTMYELTRLDDYQPITEREPETDEEAIAKEIAHSAGQIVDVYYSPSDEKYVLFSWHERLEPATMAVLAEHGLTASPNRTAAITMSHRKLKNEHDELFKATFTAEER